MTYGAGQYGAATIGGGATGLLVPEVPTPLADEPYTVESTFELLERDGTHVADLDQGLDLGWRVDRLAGSASVTLQRTDPLLSDLVAPRMIRVRYLGRAVLDGLIQPRTDTPASQREHAGQVVTVETVGHLSLLADGIVGPWSVTSRPSSDSQRFSFAHPDYVMGPGWVNATPLAQQQDITEHWTSLPPKWPAPLAWWIASSGDTTDDADPGDFYGRRKITLPAGTYQMSWTADDATEMHVDGIRQGETSDFHGFRAVNLRLSGGEHTFAVKWVNINQEPTNPTGFLFALQPLDGGSGRLGDPVLVSDSSWMILPRPASPPGWKLGRILNYVLDREQYLSGLTITRTWDNDADSDGVDWPTLPDYTVSAHTTLFRLVEQLSESYLDAYMRPGSKTLDLWNKGGRGDTDGEQFGSGFDSPAPGPPCLTSLVHRIEPPYATRLVGHWSDGWVARQITVPGFFITRTIELPNVLTHSQVVDTLDALLAIYGTERTLATAGLRPFTTAQTPHFGFRVADERQFPDGAGGWVGRTIEAIEGRVDRGGIVSLAIEAGDPLRNDEERVMTWLQQMADGALGGRSPQATSTKTEAATPLVSPEIRPLRFHRPTTATDLESDPDTPEETGRIREWIATINPAQGSDVDVDLYIDGSASGVTATVTAGQTVGRVRCNLSVTQDVDHISAHCSDLGFAIVAKAIFE